MNPTQDQNDAPGTPADRFERIAKVLDNVRATRSAGKQADDEAIIRAHADLMPELGVELEKLRRIAAARATAEAGPTNVPPIDDTAGALAAELSNKPIIQAHGYSILRELGRGGQGVVYLATQLNTGRKVAIKVMREGPFADERALTRFQREIEILASLNHPNIVTIFDTGHTTDGSRYITMNYVAGSSLDEYMKYRQKKDPADPSKLLRLFLKICAAVNAAHLRGIVHRDLKPGNIRIDEHGEPHILDFGLARTALDRFIRGSDQPVSITGDFLGSLPWSSPEQAEGDPDKIDARTDVYSLGVILYQILTGGNFPYEVAGNIRDILNNILTAEPTPPSKVIAAVRVRETQKQHRPIKRNPAIVNEAIERVVLKALAKTRDRRYQSAGELGRDVANYLAGLPTAAHGSKRVTQRNSLTTVLATLAAVAVLGVFAWACRSYLWSPSTERAPAASQPASQAVAALTSTPPAIAPVINPPASLTVDVPAPQKQVVAVDEPSSVTTPPPIPDDAVIFGGHHYKLIRQPLGWNAVVQRCREMGGHLACAQSLGKQAFLQQIKGDDMTAWVGASADAYGKWSWIDGATVPVSRIETDAQTDNYGYLFMMRNGKFAARPESGAVEGATIPVVEGFICEWDK